MNIQQILAWIILITTIVNRYSENYNYKEGMEIVRMLAMMVLVWMSL